MVSSGIGRGCPSVAGQRFLVQLSAQTLGGASDARAELVTVRSSRISFLLAGIQLVASTLLAVAFFLPLGLDPDAPLFDSGGKQVGRGPRAVGLELGGGFEPVIYIAYFAPLGLSILIIAARNTVARALLAAGIVLVLPYVVFVADLLGKGGFFGEFNEPLVGYYVSYTCVGVLVALAVAHTAVAIRSWRASRRAA